MDLFNVKENCCGCEACAQVCPKGIIKMEPDNEGFFYPTIQAPNECINCKACLNVCPVKHSNEISSVFSNAYAGWALENTDVIKSSSGGFAYVAAKLFINNGGIVYGVGYSEDYYQATYYRIDSVDKLEILRGSKYIQARKSNIYLEVKNDLNDHKVLFFGTPCDCYALSRIIKDKSRLITISLICHGPTSSLVHRKYCESLEDEYNSKINYFNLRWKKDDLWKPYYVYASFNNDEHFSEKFESSDYNKAFLNFKRPSCSSCRFKKHHFSSDILIGDYHGVSSESSSYNKHGVSVILPLNNRGIDFLNEIKSDFCLQKIPLKSAIGQQAIHSPYKRKIDRLSYTDLLITNGLRIASMQKDLSHKYSCFEMIFNKVKRYIWKNLQL